VLHPLLINLDRLLIASFISTSAVAYYATPFEVLAKLWIIPAAVTSVLLPALINMREDGPSAAHLYLKSSQSVVVLTFVPVLITILFAETGLAIWINTDFAAQAFRIARWIALAMFLNSAGHLSFISIQSQGRPSVIAKVIVAEIFIYVPILIAVARRGTIENIGQVLCVRMLTNTLVMAYVASRMRPALRGAIRRALGEWTILVVVLFAAWHLVSVVHKVILLATVVSVLAWRSSHDVRRITGLLKEGSA